MLKKSLLMVGVILSSSAMADSNSLTFDFTQNDNLTRNADNHYEMSVDGVGLTLSAWSTTSSDGSGCKEGRNVWGEKNDLCIEEASMGLSQHGLSVTNQDESNYYPEISIDNSGGDVDMVMLTFTEAVSLQGIYSTYNEQYWQERYGNYQYWYDMRRGGEANQTVMVNTGSDVDSFSGSDTVEDIMNDGWNMIGDYLQSTSIVPLINSHAYYTETGASPVLYATQWLISASLDACGWHSQLSDHFKLAGVSITQQITDDLVVAVDAPITGSLMLLSLGAVLMRRKMA